MGRGGKSLRYLLSQPGRAADLEGGGLPSRTVGPWWVPEPLASQPDPRVQLTWSLAKASACGLQGHRGGQELALGLAASGALLGVGWAGSVHFLTLWPGLAPVSGQVPQDCVRQVQKEAAGYSEHPGCHCVKSAPRWKGRLPFLWVLIYKGKGVSIGTEILLDWRDSHCSRRPSLTLLATQPPGRALSELGGRALGSAVPLVAQLGGVRWLQELGYNADPADTLSLTGSC